MKNKKGMNEAGRPPWTHWVFVVSLCYMLVFGVVFGLLGKPTQMGLSIVAVLLGMAFTRLSEIVEISGLGIKLTTRKLDKKIVQLEELEGRLAKQEKTLDEASNYMIFALITAFRDIGVLHINNQHYVFAADVVMMAVQLYAYNPKEQYQASVDAILSGMTRWVSEGSPSRGPLTDFLRKKESLVRSDYDKLKKNGAPSAIQEKYRRIMSQAGIDLEGH